MLVIFRACFIFQQLLGVKPKGRYDALEEQITSQNQNFIETQIDRQQACVVMHESLPMSHQWLQTIMKRQDEQVVDLSSDIQVLGQMAHQIDDELDEQDE